MAIRASIVHAIRYALPESAQAIPHTRSHSFETSKSVTVLTMRPLDGAGPVHLGPRPSIHMILATVITRLFAIINGLCSADTREELAAITVQLVVDFCVAGMTPALQDLITAAKPWTIEQLFAALKPRDAGTGMLGVYAINLLRHHGEHSHLYIGSSTSFALAIRGRLAQHFSQNYRNVNPKYFYRLWDQKDVSNMSMTSLARAGCVTTIDMHVVAQYGALPVIIVETTFIYLLGALFDDFDPAHHQQAYDGHTMQDLMPEYIVESLR